MWLWILFNEFEALVGLYKDLAEAEKASQKLSGSVIRGNYFSLSDFLF